METVSDFLKMCEIHVHNGWRPVYRNGRLDGAVLDTDQRRPQQKHVCWDEATACKQCLGTHVCWTDDGVCADCGATT